jgi:hypothetical protein
MLPSPIRGVSGLPSPSTIPDDALASLHGVTASLCELRDPTREYPVEGSNMFLSAVTSEFGLYRDPIRRALSLPEMTITIQEELIPTGTVTLDKLDRYVSESDAVIHLVGDMTGAMAMPASAAFIRDRYPDFAERVPAAASALAPGGAPLSYTQWEALLALYHGKPLLIATPTENARRGPRYQKVAEEVALQQEHLARLANGDHHPEIMFSNDSELAIGLLRGLPGRKLTWRRLLAVAMAMIRAAFWRTASFALIAFFTALLVRSVVAAALPIMADNSPGVVNSTAAIIGVIVAILVEVVRHIRSHRATRRRPAL